MTDTLLDEMPSATAVAAYLKRHPQFLSDYPELAAQLTLPRGEGSVASLAAYQLQQLREKNAELERRLAELVAIAAENEKLMQRVHELNVTMLRAATPAVAARSVISKLAADFHIEQVRLLLFGNQLGLPPADWLLVEPRGRGAVPEFASFLANHEPIVGRLSAERLYRLFGEQAPQVHSAAVMPLGEQGLLALGSASADHFQPGMGTLFLKMIAATVSAALTRSQELA
ncbi:DUF484 family protein [Fulvimonas soli]|jgi:uncharacterized protein YigA (DUF484 family)|uniref:DUF484 family protein n=1 Tax=Fulvimonas soli TaxID=155197 RepID=A0A316IIH8_9GAMM|nr:DUF484 family protein [Fulvimonas soli]PWK92526.1 hypothetical protein C7456_102261 [Fulvimonas soli]TNY27737.1 hypothetical protein BV497_01595 [Fulvimonas soli]